MILIISFHFRSVYSKFNYFEGQFTRRLLKTELNDAFRSVNHLRKQSSILESRFPNRYVFGTTFLRSKKTHFSNLRNKLDTVNKKLK